MTTPCNSRNTRTALTRTGALAVVFGIAFAPTAAYAAEGDPSTIKALIAGDGSVSSVERLPDGAAPSASDIPVKIGISQASEGDVTTTNYQVQNTSVQKKTVDYIGADGLPATMEQDIALPLVAQLSVRLPSSRTDVTAFGARITKLSDGSSELVWSMVLFSPIGSPITDVSFSAKGKGEPVARLDVAAVQPNSEPGLSATSQAANATVNGNGILGTVGNGASEGLTKLGEGVGKLLEGLNKLEAGAIKLNTGLVSATDGADQLAAGGVTAAKGAGDLAAGAAKVDAGAAQIAAGASKVDAGAGQLAAGAGKVDAGVGKISDGLAAASAGGAQLAAGGAQLAPGAAAAAAGAKSLSEGLALISGGLNQLSGTAGLPRALAGAGALATAVDQIRAGLGDPATSGTILNGLAQVAGGLDNVNAGLDQLVAGLPNAKGGVDQVKRGIDEQILPGLGRPTVAGQTIRYAVEQVRQGLEAATRDGGSIDNARFFLGIANQRVATAKGQLDCVAERAACDALDSATQLITVVLDGLGDSKANLTTAETALVGAGNGLTGIANGLTASSGGLGQVSAGLASAITGATALEAGVTQLQAGLARVNGGVVSVANGLDNADPAVADVAGGLDQLIAGLTAAVGGVTQLSAGAASASTGSVALADGTQKISDGASALSAGNTSLNLGLSQLFTGSQELKAGTSALAAGAGTLAAGTPTLAAGAGTLAAGTPALAAGAGKLADGVQKIADGNKKLADGLPAAADGSGAIAEGLGKVIEGQTSVGTGIGDVNSKAVAVLQSQFKQGTTLARQQLAGLDAATALAASTPGVQNTTYVLTQSKGDITAKLASADDESNMARNLGLAAGGVLLLLGGVAGGFVSGRKASVG